MSSEVETRLKAAERLLGLFRRERMTYLVVAGIAGFMLAAALVLLIRGVGDAASFTLLTGSVGLLIVIFGRLLRMWDEADDLLSRVSHERAARARAGKE